MQQFTIPQFIDVEDKIIGPITTRQFIIMLSGFALIGICYKIFDFSAFMVVGLLILIISGIFSFAKINGRPFHLFILNLIQTLKKPGLRVWNHTIGKIEAEYKLKEEKEIKEISLPPAKHYTTSRLAELALIVDTRGVYKGGEKDAETKIETINNNI
ncbi:PrgI family protein [Candidatus Parcubacteria bacterium]|nr:PrgI family protein [Candidatus Parcubacteria bacterium]